MKDKKIAISEAVKFHGHLGPYLILGVRAGELALERLKCGKHFGISVKVWGAHKKPKSCLIDGLQLSTGATYGKGNIEKFDGSTIKMEFKDNTSKKKVLIRFKQELVEKLNKTILHRDCETLAKELYSARHAGLFFSP